MAEDNKKLMTLNDFKFLSRDEKLEIAKECWGSQAAFDNLGRFAFSYSAFSNLCEEIGFVKKKITIVTDSQALPEAKHTLSIDIGKREATKEKKYTLAIRTIKNLDEIGAGLSAPYKSRLINAIIDEAVAKYLDLKGSKKSSLEIMLSNTLIEL